VTSPTLAGQIRARAPWLDALTPRADDTYRADEQVACDWKVLLDNCTECYHCAIGHPAFVDLVDIATYHIDVGPLHTMHTGVCSKPRNAAYHYPDDAPVRDFTFWHVWPNITFGIMPGSENFMAFSIDPVAPGRCRTRSLHLVPPGGASAVDEARDAYTARVLWPEDKGIVESVQRGLGSLGYNRGRFIVNALRHDLSEHAAQFFQARIRAALEA